MCVRERVTADVMLCVSVKRGVLCVKLFDGCGALLSHTMYSLISFRKSIPTQTVNLIFQLVIVNNKLTILWGS